MDRRGNESTIRWRLAATIGPEVIAFGLSVLLVLAVIMAIGQNPPADGPRRSSEPTSLVSVRDQAPADQPAPRRST
jgi:hypothetical protein